MRIENGVLVPERGIGAYRPVSYKCRDDELIQLMEAAGPTAALNFSFELAKAFVEFYELFEAEAERIIPALQASPNADGAVAKLQRFDELVKLYKTMMEMGSYGEGGQENG